MVVIDILEQQDIRCNRSNEMRNRRYLIILIFKDILQQQARTIACQFHIVGGDPKDFGIWRAECKYQCRSNGDRQARCKASS